MSVETTDGGEDLKDDSLKGDDSLMKDLTDDTPEEETKEEEVVEEQEVEEETKEESILDKGTNEEVGGAEDVEDGTTLDFPENSVLSEEVKDGLTNLVDSIDIDEETLGEVGGLLETATQDGFNSFKEQFTEEQNARRDAVSKDPLFSDANREKTWGNIQEVAKKYGGDDKGLADFFKSYHSLDPSLMRMLNNVGEALKSNPEFGGTTTNMPSPESDDSNMSQMTKEYGAMLGG